MCHKLTNILVNNSNLFQEEKSIKMISALDFSIYFTNRKAFKKLRAIFYDLLNFISKLCFRKALKREFRGFWIHDLQNPLLIFNYLPHLFLKLWQLSWSLQILYNSLHIALRFCSSRECIAKRLSSKRSFLYSWESITLLVIFFKVWIRILREFMLLSKRRSKCLRNND